MAAQFGYSNVANPAYLVGSMAATGDTVTVTVSATPGGAATAPQGWPGTLPCWAVIDLGNNAEEVVQVTAISGSQMTLLRSSSTGANLWFGTENRAHSANAEINHVAPAWNFWAADAHINATQNVHGIAAGSSVVGTTDTQTLTNKTLTAPILTGLVNTAAATFAGPIKIVNSAAGTVPVSVTGASGQTANLSEWHDSSNNLLAWVDPSGSIRSNKTIQVSGSNAADNDLLVKMAAGQTGLPLVIQDSTGASVFNVTPGGTGNFQGGISTVGNANIGGNLAVTGIGQQVFVRKTANQTVTNSVTYQNDTELQVGLAANATYIFEAFIGYSTPSAAGINIRFSYNSTQSSSSWTSDALVGESGDSGSVRRGVASVGTGFGLSGGAGSTFVIALPKGVINTTAAGVLFFEWSQNVANATGTVVGANSWLRAIRVA